MVGLNSVSSKPCELEKGLTCFIEEEGVLVLLHVLRGACLVQEERIDAFNVLHLDLGTLTRT